MVHIDLKTQIAAPMERCFDLARSIDVHMASTNQTGEQAIAGVTSGLIGAGETVTWRGRHFGFTVKHTSRITAFTFPSHFQDSMVRGMFLQFCHDHYFETKSDLTVMSDVMEFQAPFGVAGRLAEKMALREHLRSLLEKRNNYIKRVAESDEWKKYLPLR